MKLPHQTVDQHQTVDRLFESAVNRVADAVADRLDKSSPEKDADGLVDEPTMADQLGVSQQTLQRRRKAGKVPFVKLGRRVLYRASDVIAELTQKEGGGE